MTENEIINDWNILEDGCKLTEKKALATKYNAAAVKAKDIYKAMAVEMKKVRAGKTEFTDDDCRWYSRLEVPAREEVTALCDEPIAFVEMLRINAEARLKKAHYGCIAWNHADRWLKTVNKALTEMKKTDVEKAEEKAKADFTAKLEVRLTEELADFKKNWLKRVKTGAATYYEGLPSKYEVAKANVKRERERLDKMFEEKNIRGYYKWSYEDHLRKLEKEEGRIRATLRMFKTVDEFVNKALADAEDKFKYNVSALAEKINSRGLDYTKLTVSNVKNDPKLFEMLVTDGNIKLYCRSILAAQWSEKVIAHFRFIMTERS